jgi:hypothetical protein
VVVMKPPTAVPVDVNVANFMTQARAH